MKTTENNLKHVGVKSIKTEIVLSKEQFTELYSFLNIIKPHFNDFCIADGQFRARSDNLVCIIETVFNYFKGVYFNIADINPLVKMLSNLDRKDAIIIAIDATKVVFTDNYQKVVVANTDPAFIDNKYMNGEELNGIIFDHIDKPFIKESLPKSVVCSINKVTRDLKSGIVSFKHTEADVTKGYILISSNMREYTIRLINDFLTPMKKGHYYRVSNLPFIFDKADMILCHSINKDNNMVLTVCSTSINGLDINIYGRSGFLEEENQ